MQLSQVGKVAQLRRDTPTQLILIEGQLSQGGKVAQLRRDTPTQLIPYEIQHRQFGEVAQLGGDAPTQLTLIEEQRTQAGEVANLRRDLSVQAVCREVQIGHPPAVRLVRANLVQIPPKTQSSSRRPRVGAHSMPITKRGVTLPIGLVMPICSIRGVVESDKRRTIRRIVTTPRLPCYTPGRCQLLAYSRRKIPLDLLCKLDRHREGLKDERVVRLFYLPRVDVPLPRPHHGRALFVIGSNLVRGNHRLHSPDQLRKQLRYLPVRCGDPAVRVRKNSRSEIHPSRRAVGRVFLHGHG